MNYKIIYKNPGSYKVGINTNQSYNIKNTQKEPYKVGIAT